MPATTAKDLARHIEQLLTQHPPWSADGMLNSVRDVERVELPDGRWAAIELLLENGEGFRIQVSRISR